MSDYSSLKATINANVKANNNHEITGSIMNSVLNAMVDSLGAGYQFMGVATPTNPGSAQTPDYKCFYLATTPGTYTYLGGLVVADGEVALLKYDSSWTKEVTGIASADKLNQLGQQAIYDVSANNVGATFASLSALLSDENLSTLIPVAVRCGGMSIRFVQTSDNKYVQYRCKTQSFSANQEDWYFCGDETLVENPEFIKVWLDKSGRIFMGIENNGNVYFGAGVPKQIVDYVNAIIGNFSPDEYNDIVTFLDSLITGDKTLAELLNEKVDKEDGKGLIQTEVAENLEYTDSPEFMNVELDGDNKILGGRKPNGNKFENLPVEYPSAVEESVSDPEGRFKVILDGYNRIMSYRDKNGVLHENVGIETNHFSLTEEGMEAFQQDLINSGFDPGSGGHVQEEIDAINDEISHIQDNIDEIEDSLDVNPPAVVALRNELDGVETRVDALEQVAGVTPPMVTGYKRIASETIITQAELNSWDGKVVEVVGDLVLSGSTNFKLNNGCVIFMNGGKFINDNYIGTLNLNGAYVKAEPYRFLDLSINYSNQLHADVAFAEWFGALGDNESYDAKYFNGITDNVHCNEIHLVAGKTYILEAPITLKNHVLRGDGTSKLVYCEDYADIPITSNTTAPIIAVDGCITITVDNTAKGFENLKAGMCVNIMPTNKALNDDTVKEWNNRLIKSVSNDGTVVLTGGDYTKVSATYTMNIATIYPMIVMFNNSQIHNLHIIGGYHIVDKERNCWRQAETIDAGVADESLEVPNQAYNQVIENCIIEDNTSDAIVSDGGHTKIHHNVLKHCGSGGIHLGSNMGCVITDNFIFDTNLNANQVHNEAAIIYSNRIYNLLISGNYIDNCKSGIGTIHNTWNCKSTIVNNIINNFRKNGIEFALNYIPESPGLFKQYIISGNRFNATNDYNENYYERRYEEVPYTPRVTATGYGVSMVIGYGEGLRCESIIVSNNIFKDCGVKIMNCDGAVVNGNNLIFTHVFEADHSRQSSIIHITNSNVVVNGNYITSEGDGNIEEIVFAQTSSKVLFTSNIYKNTIGVLSDKDNTSDITSSGNIQL